MLEHNRGGTEVVYVQANPMSPSAVNTSVPAGGSIPVNGSAYHL